MLEIGLCFVLLIAFQRERKRDVSSFQVPLQKNTYIRAEYFKYAEALWMILTLNMKIH